MKFLVTIIVVSFLIGCSHTGANTKKSNTIDMKACSKDSQCVSVAASCCGCSSGGKNMAISSQKKSEWNKIHDEVCAKNICPMMMSNDPSCDATPVCIAGKCKLDVTQ